MSAGFGQGSYTVEDEGLEWFDVPNQTGTPERRLLLAILERAILDFVGNDSAEAQTAQGWLFEEPPPPYTAADPFSLAWVCHHLDLEQDRIVSHIKAMPKRGNNRVAPWYFMKEKVANQDSEVESTKSQKVSNLLGLGLGKGSYGGAEKFKAAC